MTIPFPVGNWSPKLHGRQNEVPFASNKVDVALRDMLNRYGKQHMMKYRRISLGLELGSAAIEERLTEIALLMRKTFPDYYWKRRNMDDHREMHILLNGREEPVCFTDRELINYSNRRRRIAIDHRMRDALTRLLDA